jgi:alpha-glucosidase
MQTKNLDWWKSATVYQIYPRSFQDSDGTGTGDLNGIASRLGYLSETLGIDTIWLSPIQKSPQEDFGYDISDYCAIDPLFGSMDAFKNLLAAVHERGMRLVLDGVFNHTSDQHPWFLESRRSVDSPKRLWYIWRDGSKAPNNWGAVFGGSAWTRAPETGESYLHSFSSSQPDLNWRNPQVVDAVLESMRFWLDLGVDGFRLDVFNCYFKDESLRSNPRRVDPVGLVGGLAYPFIGQHHLYDRDQPEMESALVRMRSMADSYGAVLVGETLDERFLYRKAAGYCGMGKLHMAFHFGLLNAKWGAKSFHAAIRSWLDVLPEDGWPTWVLSNHDFPRQASRWGGKDADARAGLAPLMVCCLRGTPFLYYGEELGMREARLARSQIRDPPGRRFWPLYRGRDGCRTPMQWDSSPGSGFSRTTPWLPLGEDAGKRNVEHQLRESRSVLNAYREAIALRKTHRALAEGSITELDCSDGILSWIRETDSERLLVALNMENASVPWETPGQQIYTNGQGRSDSLGPYEGRVVRLEG